MKSVIVALVAIGVLGSASPALADATVRPNDRKPDSLLVEADRVREQSDPGYAARNGRPVYHKDPVDTICSEDAQDVIQCYVRNPEDPEVPDEPELTEGDVLRAVREIGLPSLRVRIQPGTSTLVNVPTIFYTEPQPFNRSVTLLGFDIDLVATPIRYRWLHGDGTASTTAKPGKPYPSTEVTHRYRQPADAVHPRVDVTYRVRYRVDRGAWETIDQTLLASGPTAALQVKEAAPVLTYP